MRTSFGVGFLGVLLFVSAPLLLAVDTDDLIPQAS